MIRYNLKCEQNHMFDSWFQSAGAYETLQTTRQLACPECGSTRIDKALMAPGVKGPAQEVDVIQKEHPLAKLRQVIEANSDYVGNDFATQARAMHEGEKPHRPIYGEAAPVEVKSLVEDGVSVAPLPFIPKAKTN